MTENQKEAYKDAVIYLMQYAKAMETDKHQQKFCLYIAKKAELLHNFKPHLFHGTGIKEDIEERIKFYENNEDYNTKKYDTSKV